MPGVQEEEPQVWGDHGGEKAQAGMPEGTAAQSHGAEAPRVFR